MSNVAIPLQEASRAVTPKTNFPHYSDKYDEPSITGPEVFGTEPLEQTPKTVIICLTKFLEPAVTRVVSSRPQSVPSKVFPDLHFLSPKVALLKNPIFLGAPLAVAILERLIYRGVKDFLIFGIAGSLREGTNIGDVVVCDKAIRDEGTSYHYEPPSEFAYPTPEVPERLVAFLRERGHNAQVGATWTTDAIFRETPLEIRRFGERGILTVEMEASALFSVARYRNVSIGAVFVISDLVHKKTWERGMDGAVMSQSIDEILPHLVEFSESR